MECVYANDDDDDMRLLNVWYVGDGGLDDDMDAMNVLCFRAITAHLFVNNQLDAV